jgi:hypothetical protein
MKMTKEELERFEGGLRRYKAFNFGDRSYATDGRVLIRTEAVEGVMDGDAETAAVYDGVFPSRTDSKYTRVDNLKLSEVVGATQPCGMCDGSGEHKCPCCETVHACGACHGKRFDASSNSVTICGMAFVASANFMRAAELPGFVLHVPKPTSETFDLRNAYFTFDGGDGVVALANNT